MSLDVPNFASEAEEADWWFEHRAEVEAELVQAAAEGRLQQRSSVLPESSALNLIPVEAEDAALAAAQSIREGLPFEEHAKRLFHEAVQARELRKTG
jgi:hypothetical protein